MIVVTGTEDVLPLIATKWEDHLASFETAPANHSLALIFDGADHYFNGAFGRIDDRRANQPQIAALNDAVLAFAEHARAGLTIADIHIPNLPAGAELRRR